MPADVSSDGERVSRFQREAEVLATLNHLNIAAIYDLSMFGETQFLVLDLVEGETLADRIARGPIKQADRRSDIFSFGVVLFEMLTGARPFEGENFIDVGDV